MTERVNETGVAGMARIDGVRFADMLRAGYALLAQNRELVNELNVFPVPDGDTGTNMSLTLEAAVNEADKRAAKSLGEAAAAAAAGALRGARGNSGVILSLLLRGFAKDVKDCADIDGARWAQALGEGAQTAYRAVMKPAEGTMLSVSREVAALAAAAAKLQTNCTFVLQETVKEAHRALAQTIEQNPVLKKAGVVDAGAKGLCLIWEGMLAGFQGDTALLRMAGRGAPVSPSEIPMLAQGEEIRFAYCTELLVERTAQGGDPLRLRAFLESQGDSLVFVEDESILKVHVHTNHPGRVIEEALAYGMLAEIKVDNMRKQHSERIGMSQEKSARPAAEPPAQPAAAPPMKPAGFVAVCSGDGLEAVFKDLGADHVVRGGQTMNPSTEELLACVNATPAETVFILPNNKNIIMAAQQCAPLSDKKVIVIPSATIPQGVSALLSYEPERDPQHNAQVMREAVSGVKTGQVTMAARDANFDGHRIDEGDFMALREGALLCVSRDRALTLEKLAQGMADKDASFVTVYYGEGGSPEEARRLSERFAALCPMAEITVVDGGQPVYFYIVSVE